MKTRRNLLVQYKGGGYDGCYWEWNFFMFDGRGKFINLKTSGHRGINTRAEALEVLKNRNEIYTYNLKSKKALKEFALETNNHLVDVIGTLINQYYKKEMVYFECHDCGEKTFLSNDNSGYPRMFHNNNEYHWETALCESCYFNHSCGYCGAFNESEENNVDDEGHCECCAEVILKEFNASEFGKRNDIAIHLLNPSEFELSRAKEDALAKGFNKICIYRSGEAS